MIICVRRLPFKSQNHKISYPSLPMRKIFISAIFLLSLLSLHAQRDYAALVNPFIGTGGHGHTYPGASVPFGMMQLSPDTRMADWDGSSGYHYSDTLIYGFSHTHLSGTGIPDYCDLLLMPFTGNPGWEKENYRSGFSHKNEKAAPGYYEVVLDKYQIKARLTTTTRAGMHEYEFPAGVSSKGVLIDLLHRDQLLGSHMEQVGSHAIRGWRRSRSWARDQTLYFYLEFDQIITNLEWQQQPLNKDGNSSETMESKASIRFNTKSQKLRCRVGISGVSMEGAQQNLKVEMNTWVFDSYKQKAYSLWNKELAKIDVKGGTKDQQVCFYTALYHTFLVPNTYQDTDGQFRGTDLKVHTAKDFTNYSVFSLWDTYRAYHPLMTIINQKRTTDWIKTFLAQYQYGGMLPVWELSGNETFCMIGYHSVPVIVDAYQKGIRNFDTQLALKAMRSYAESDRYGLEQYRQQGFISNDKEHESVSKTLEYAYDDWCIAQFARQLGNNTVYKDYLQRSQSYKNVFDPQTHHMRGKVQASWQSPFDPKEINNYFTEGNSWQYSFAVPQDIKNLIRLHGGNAPFLTKLNELFSTSSKTTGREQADVTGLIGQYAQGNEPSHHMAYLFSYAGQSWRTQELLHQIFSNFYTNTPDGLIGNEDCGQMSAWYILSSMGFYPVCPGSGEYVLGTPLFDEVTIHLENGKQFKVLAKDRSAGFYVRQTLLNGTLYQPVFLKHADLWKGGVLQFDLSGTANKERGTKEKDLPHSSISEHPVVAVPFFAVPSNKFHDSMSVYLGDIEAGATMYYHVVYSSHPFVGSAVKYEGPFRIWDNCTVYAYALKDGRQSNQVSQSFIKIPDDRSINVLSKVHPMYTAGGPDALIDGQQGSENWRSGDWQSYFDQDFEAIVDLKTIRKISFLGIHVLQDVSPWILYPKGVHFSVSSDGKQFTDLPEVSNQAGQQEGAVTQILGTSVSLEARYVKVKAITGGRLPASHESAGNPSHLFIDEIIIR
jgi:predicted alpha-1,2-mannosidase